MNTTSNLSVQLPKIREYVIDVLHDNEERSIYTTIGRLYRMEKNIQTLLAEEKVSEEVEERIHLHLYIDMMRNARSKLKKVDFEKSKKEGEAVCKELAEKFKLSDTTKNKALQIIAEAAPIYESTLPASKVFQDAILMEFAGYKGRDHLKALYEEMILRDFEMPESNWYDTLINFISGVEAATSYGKIHIQPNVEKLVKKLKKEKKEIENRTSLLLKKELGISEEEIKKLKKDINKAQGRDERGIQTLFRTTIKNHYTLNEMIDRKASIMITVNSIILSLVMSGVIGSEHLTLALIPVLLLSITSISSIIFAIIAIRPLLTQGDFTEEEIRNKEGNLLYFGNFHNMYFRDFEWAFLQMLNDKNYLYGSMIRDYYYQGIGLQRKYKHIRLSLTIFLFGFGVSFLCFIVFRLLGY